MKTTAFEKGKNLGYGEKELAAQWEKIRADCGAEPTPAMLAAYDTEPLLDIGVARPLAKAWGPLFVPADAPTKSKRFKPEPEKARRYTAAEIVSFIVADPTQDGLKVETLRRTGGAPFLFVVDGKIAEPESADRIQRLFDRDPVAPFVRINSKDVKPLPYPSDAAKTDPEDPFKRGVPLGQPGNVSTHLGVSLDGTAHETMQAVACAMEFDLTDASKRELRLVARAAKGKTAAEFLTETDYPDAFREWPTWPKPTLLLPRVEEEKDPNPTVADADVAVIVGRTMPPTPRIPRLFVLTCGEKALTDGEKKWRSLRIHFVPVSRAGKITVVADVDCPNGADTEDWLASQVAQASAVLVLVNPTTNSSHMVASLVETARATKKLVLPILVSPCLTDFGPFAGRVFLCERALYSEDHAPDFVHQIYSELNVS